MKHLKLVIAILLMLFVVILLVENHEAFSVRVSFKLDLLALHYQSADVTLYAIVTIAFLFGVLVTGIYGMVERFRLKNRIKTLQKSSAERDEELNSLRNLPITSDDMGSDHPNGV